MNTWEPADGGFSPHPNLARPTFAQPAPPPPSQASSGCGTCLVIGLIAGFLGILAMVGVGVMGWMLVRNRMAQSAKFEADFNVQAPQQFGPAQGFDAGAAGFQGMPGAGGLVLAPLPDPPPPATLLPVMKLTADEMVSTGDLVERGAGQFEERAPEGGVLVGLRLVKGQNWGGAICGVQAIYQVGDRYALGASWRGYGGVEQMEFLAKPGYAVGAIQCRSGLALNAVRIEFRRVAAEALLAEDVYQTPWYGCDGGSEQPPVDSQGSFLVGLRGSYTQDLSELGSYRALLLGKPTAALPKLKDTKIVDRLPAGNQFGSNFADSAPAGGMLVGFRLAQGVNWGGALRSVQPIYQVGDEYKLGHVQGQPGGKMHQLLPPPGYAVGKVETDTGLVLDGIRVFWYLVKPDGTLDPGETRSSDYVGVRGGSITMLDSRGQPIGGIYGAYQEDVNQFGIMVMQASGVEP